MTENEKIMEFRIGEETAPVILNAENYKSTPFWGILEKGMEVLASFIENNEQRIIANSNPKDNIEEDCRNNIISFLGDRGSGKTSCLLSVEKIFPSYLKYEDRSVKSSKIEFLPIIDPSFFDKSHNILEIFIGELYRDFRELVKHSEKHNNSEEYRDCLRDLQTEFTKVKKALRYVDGTSKDFEDEHIELLRLSDGVNLSKVIGKLIDCYLKCKGKDFLVVSIDDVDLNVPHAYTMMEQLRKYLRHWNVAVLMAAKYEQLIHCVSLQLSNTYQSIIGKSINFTEIIEMSERYLDKLMPLDQRIFMPEFKEYYGTHKLVIYGYNQVFQHPLYEFDSINFAVPSLIFEKCGFLFYNSSNESSLIIPRNLRELRMLITMIVNMQSRESGKDDKECRKIHETNKTLFKNYFYQQWIGTLPQEHLKWIKSLIRENNLYKINKLVVSHLFNTYKSLREKNESTDSTKSDRESDYTENKIIGIIGNPENRNGNISIGDVMTVLGHLSDISDSDELYRFIFFIKTFYSITLYEAYDRMTNPEEEMNKVSENQIPLLKTDTEYANEDYFNLVGFSFFLLDGNTFLPTRKGSGESRELALLAGDILIKEIRWFVKKYKEPNDKGSTNMYMDDNDSEITNTSTTNSNEKFSLLDIKERLRFNLLEFFILTSSRKIDKKGEKDYTTNLSDWRIRSYENCFKQLGYGTRNILFDVSAPFINMVNPEYAYCRYDKDFYEIALRFEGSLLNQLLKLGRRYPENETPISLRTDLMSRVAIRNIEVLNDIYKWLKAQKSKLRPDSNGDIGLLSQFYQLFSDTATGYRIKTYDKVDEEKIRGDNSIINYHDITFHPLAILGSYLAEILPNRLFQHDDMTDEQTKEINECIDIFLRIYRLDIRITANQDYSLEDVLFVLDKIDGDKTREKVKIISKIFENQDTISGRNIAQALAEKISKVRDIFHYIFGEELQKRYFEMILSNIEDKIAGMEKRNDDLKKEKVSHSTANDMLNTEITNLKNSESVIEQNLAIIQHKISSLKYRQLNLSKEIPNLQEVIDEYQVRLLKINKELANTEVHQSLRYSDLLQQQEICEKEIESRNAQLYKMSIELDENTHESKKNIEEEQKTREEHEIVKQRIISLKAQRDSIEPLLIKLESDCKHMANELVSTKKKFNPIALHVRTCMKS